MLITTDKVYYFSFSSPFDSLDGMYLVQQIHSYDEIIANGVNMVEFLYGKVGLNQATYESDRVSYTGSWISTNPGFSDDQFYKLCKRDVEEEEILYVPLSLLADYPDPNVARYNKIMVMLDLGAFEDPEDLTAIPSMLSERLEVNYGIATVPQLATYDDVWMKTEDYQTLESDREALKGEVINYYSEARRLEAENKRLLSKIAALENIITSS